MREQGNSIRTSAKLVEFFNKLSTFQVSIIPASFETTTKKDDQGIEHTFRTVSKEGVFFVEVVPHTKDSSEDRPTRIWDDRTKFALSVLESYRIESQMKGKGLKTDLQPHKNQKDGTINTLWFEKTTKKDKEGNNILDKDGNPIWYVKVGCKNGDKFQGSQMTWEQFGLFIDLMGRIRPYLTGVMETVEPILIK